MSGENRRKMLKLVPIRESVVCRKLEQPASTSDGGILHENKTVDLYEIVSISDDSRSTFPFFEGDVVMSCSTGSEIEVNEGEVLFLFKTENIMCKVEV